MTPTEESPIKCPKCNGRMQLVVFKPEGDEGEGKGVEVDRCVGCALCREACITEPKAVIIRSLQNTGN